jgi:hypothetical protein
MKRHQKTRWSKVTSQTKLLSGIGAFVLLGAGGYAAFAYYGGTFSNNAAIQTSGGGGGGPPRFNGGAAPRAPLY